MGKVIKKKPIAREDLDDHEVTQIAAVRGGRVISGDRYEARAEAQGIRERAQAEAEHIIAAAKQEAEDIRQRALTAAKKTGYDEGRAQGANELTEAVAQLALRRQKTEAQLIPQLKQLALGIAKKILGRELEFHPEAMVQIVKQALAEKARTRREISLRVHPDDLELLKEHKEELMNVLSRCPEIGLREDPSVNRHGVIIETDAGSIDAQLETQFAIFERVLQDA